MDDDLDTSSVVDLLFRAVRQANTALDAGDPATAAPLAAAVREICRAVGLVLDAGGEGSVPADVLAMVAQRDEARAARDWARADELRDDVQAAGWVVEDTASGAVVRRA
jgi:cysteinyl-tRNA synthetase